MHAPGCTPVPMHTALASVALVWALSAQGAPAGGAAADAWLPDDARRPAAYVVEAGGNILARHADQARRQPASLAKLAAAVVVAEAARANAALLEASATVSAQAAAATGTRLGLRAGQRVAASQLLAAMLVGSANDACLALAEHLAGDAAAFADRMNSLAARLGMTATHFVDPCGFDRTGQHTTASDLLKLARRALEEPLILGLAERTSIRVLPQGGARALSMRSTNALLGRYDGALGLKTGYTRQAGPCIIAVARRDGLTAIAIVLGAQDRWPVTVALLDEAFDRATGMPRVRSRSAIGEPDA